MSAKVIDLDAHRPGWRVCTCRCAACGGTWIAAVHPAADLDVLECATCRTMTGRATAVLDWATDVMVPR